MILEEDDGKNEVVRQGGSEGCDKCMVGGGTEENGLRSIAAQFGRGGTEEMTILCKHKTQNLPYLPWHRDAERRQKAGENQIQCPACGLWIWESLYRRKK